MILVPAEQLTDLQSHMRHGHGHGPGRQVGKIYGRAMTRERPKLSSGFAADS